MRTLGQVSLRLILDGNVLGDNDVSEEIGRWIIGLFIDLEDYDERYNDYMGGGW